MSVLRTIEHEAAVLRTMEREGKRYVYGYPIIFDSPDGHGTIATKEFVESNLPRLKRFPAVRFQHNIPLGQIDFETDLGDGIRTFIDDHGFHVLARIYDEREAEWKMIKEGNWGWSFGSMPDGYGKKCIGDKCYPSFEKGVLYELSVVDSPSHIESIALAVQRSFDDLRAALFEEAYTFSDDGHIEKRYFPISQNVSETYQELDFPETCSMTCPHVQCGFRRPENDGRPCFHRISAVPKNP